jgi:phosphonoacetaldehyde hydrolase
MSEKLQHLTAVVFDWAGTTVDHGSRAPALVFQEIFRRRGVEITLQQAREPMGMSKRDHIAAILQTPEVANMWRQRHGVPWRERDIDDLYEHFLPLQKSVLQEYSQVIAGVPEAVEECRRMGLKIGSTTGYTRTLMEVVSQVARQQNYAPDCIVCADDVAHGRPAPDLLMEAARRLGVSRLEEVVNVDDTPVGVEAGRNAGCWTVGVTRTGNGVGLSQAELEALQPEELQRRCGQAAARLRAAGAHYTIESVVEIPQVLRDIDQRAARE